jgi:hypothetical protein
VAAYLVLRNGHRILIQKTQDENVFWGNISGYGREQNLLEIRGM